MSVKTRHQERLELFAVFINELATMPTELYRTLAEWTLSVGILFLILEGQIGGTVGVAGVTMLMSVDVARLYTIYKKVQVGKLQELDKS
jgi:hypothetical protein